jgi:hypothetical protein
VVCAVSLVISSCKKREIYPEIPSIEFKSYYFTQDPILPTDTLMGIIFSYRDGDGDIGLNAGDTFAPYNSIRGDNNRELNPYYYNLHIDYLALNTATGQYEHVIIPNTIDTLVYEARVQNITPDGKHKAIRGDIDWQILPPPYPGVSRTIKVRVKIYDRALHASNTIESPAIRLP